MRKVCSFIIKILVLALCVVAFTIFSGGDNGEEITWAVMFMYFTGQSNLWIALVFVALIVFFILRWANAIKQIPRFLYILKFVFTVCISMTLLVFCGVIAPFAGSSYNAWAGYSVITHLAVPVLSIADFFIDDYPLVLCGKEPLYAFLPPVIYFSITSVLCVLKVNFGRGYPFPYFFMNFYSKVGMFGFEWGNPPLIGSAYWFIILTLCFSLITLALYFLSKSKKSLSKAR